MGSWKTQTFQPMNMIMNEISRYNHRPFFLFYLIMVFCSAITTCNNHFYILAIGYYQLNFPFAFYPLNFDF